MKLTELLNLIGLFKTTTLLLPSLSVPTMSEQLSLWPRLSPKAGIISELPSDITFVVS